MDYLLKTPFHSLKIDRITVLKGTWVQIPKKCVTQWSTKWNADSNSLIYSIILKLLTQRKFIKLRENFPADSVSKFASNYSPIISYEKLNNEISVIYHNDIFKDIPSVSELFSFFMHHSFEESFSEVHKSLQIALTTPVLTAEAEMFQYIDKNQVFP